jgi:GDP/UDP-N,N'-diacetylbacillosamine 2-epimerase (hydrolysing)
VHVVGAPALDQALRRALDFERGMGSLASIDAALSGGYGLLLLHPSSADEDLERKRALMAVDAVRRVFPRGKLEVIGPNNDPGHRGILRAYEERKRQVALRLSMPQEEFWGKLLTLGVLVGNSSSGIIEAATFGCAVVNIGERQAGRERNANVIDVDWDVDAIEKAVRRASTDEGFKRQVAQRKNVYGDGKAGTRIVTVLEQLAREGIGLEKRFVDG